MTAFIKNICIICNKDEEAYWVHIPNYILPVCEKCWNIATKIHQLNFFNPKMELKIKIKK